MFNSMRHRNTVFWLPRQLIWNFFQNRQDPGCMNLHQRLQFGLTSQGYSAFPTLLVIKGEHRFTVPAIPFAFSQSPGHSSVCLSPSFQAFQAILTSPLRIWVDEMSINIFTTAGGQLFVWQKTNKKIVIPNMMMMMMMMTSNLEYIATVDLSIAKYTVAISSAHHHDHHHHHRHHHHHHHGHNHHHVLRRGAGINAFIRRLGIVDA